MGGTNKDCHAVLMKFCTSGIQYVVATERMHVSHHLIINLLPKSMWTSLNTVQEFNWSIHTSNSHSYLLLPCRTGRGPSTLRLQHRKNLNPSKFRNCTNLLHRSSVNLWTVQNVMFWMKPGHFFFEAFSGRIVKTIQWSATNRNGMHFETAGS